MVVVTKEKAEKFNPVVAEKAAKKGKASKADEKEEK